MEYFLLAASVISTFAATFDFKGRPSDALLASLAVFYLGMFLSV
jgi:hypothetical protein